MKLKNTYFFLFSIFSMITLSFGQSVRTLEDVSAIPKEKRIEEIMHLDEKVAQLTDSINHLYVSLNNQIKDLSITVAKSIELETCSKIGDQYWMKRNLNVTSFNDNETIVHAQTKAQWDSCFVNGYPAYCYHQKDSLRENGVLYNIHALNSPKLAPIGYVIPTVDDVEIMLKSFGSLQAYAALMLKSGDNDSWPHVGLDLFDLNIKPNGFRLEDGINWYYGDKIYFYCDAKNKESLTFFVLSDFSDKIYFLNRNKINDNVNYGMYVRCLKANK